jgi:signal transduction histidine kinase/CheY-like chemotaxis protein
MTDNKHEAYRKQVEEIGQTLLDAIASVSAGNYDHKIDIPDDIGVFSDLAVGLQFLIEDLQQAGTNGSLSPSRQISEITAAPLADDSSAAQFENRPRYGSTDQTTGMTLRRGSGMQPVATWMPEMDTALAAGAVSTASNGEDSHSLALPIRLQDQVVGVLGFNRKTGHPWSAQEIAAVETITEQLGLALEKQRLFDQTQTALAETELLYNATAELNTAQNYTDILRVIENYTEVGRRSNRMRIVLFDQAAAPGQIPATYYALASLPEDPLAALQEGTAPEPHPFTLGEILTPDRVTLISDPANDPGLPETPRRALLQTSDARSFAFIPLLVAGQWIGYIELNYPELIKFSEDDLRRTSSIGAQASVAIQNLYSIEIAQRAVEEMREVDRLKSEFLANMSHELRTPLNSIIGFSRVILKGIDGPINELQQQDLEAIHHSGQHLLDMINNILDLSKIEAGKMELRIEEIQLDDVIDSVVSTARGLVKEKPIRLLTEIPEQLPVVSGDRTRVRQIMLNLLQNAAKFTDEGTITVKIESLPEEGQMKISVHDTGIGIAEEDQDKLFERFSQVDSSLTRKVGGSGLGLSITKLLVEMQGGVIDLSSEVGQGSVFWFTLPLVDKVVEQKREEEPIEPGKKVVVSIDDDEQIIGLYKRYLRSHGYQVVGITDPKDVIPRLIEIQPYAITLDLMMPQKDGWQVIQEIKSHPDTAHIPVIICSIVEEKERAYQLGAVDYLVKPILERELVTAIDNLHLEQTRLEPHILVIDDDPNVFQLIQIALRDHTTYKLNYANGGFEGLEQLNALHPDAVILDIMMPDLDGFSILETMQGDPVLRTTPVIILTAADLSPEQRQILENNKREVITKDGFKSQYLIEFLEKALEKVRTDQR